MTTMAPTNKGSYAATRLRGQMEFVMSWSKITVHLSMWFWALLAMVWVFILPYNAAMGNEARVFPHQLAERMGDEFFLGIGILICALILWYMTVLISKAMVMGSLFRVTRDGLLLCQANNFFISRKSIRSAFLDYRFGIVSTVVLELNDRKVLRALSKQLPAMASITCNPKRSAVTIDLAGVKNKMKFARAVMRLIPR